MNRAHASPNTDLVPLPKILHFQGDRLVQRKRVGNVAWYDRSGHVIEIIKIRVRKAWMWQGTLRPTQEVYPGTSDFGPYAKCISGPNREKRAQVVFQMFVSEEQEKALQSGHSENPALSPPSPTHDPNWRNGGVH